jgi:abortive infection bacteriophage resistance protein
VENNVEKCLTGASGFDILFSVIVLQKPVRPATGGAPAGAPFFTNIHGWRCTSMAKPFLTYQQQIDKLQNEKGLVINDVQYAETMLKQTSYFALITGYKHLFKNKTTGMYKDGTRFEDIVALYMFDKGLREIFLKYLCQIERHIRSLISYYFSEKFGESQNEYLDVNHYRYNGANIPKINRLVTELSNPIRRPDCPYEYIRHYVVHNRNVPLWVLLNTVTFGTLSKMYMYLTQDLQIKVSRNFPGVNESQLSKVLSILSKYRNVCAHNERLFTHTVKESIPDMPLHHKLGIPKKGGQYIQGKSDLFSVVISLRYLLLGEDFLQFKKELVARIETFKKNSGAIQEAELLSAMGFSENWKRITAYHK